MAPGASTSSKFASQVFYTIKVRVVNVNYGIFFPEFCLYDSSLKTFP